MPIFEDDKEIKIIRKKFNLSEEKGESLALILDHYFFSNYSFYFDDLIHEIIEGQMVANEVAKEIAMTACLLLINEVKPEIKKDLEKLLQEQKINIEQKQNELKEIELEILSPRDLSYLNIDERAEALDIFKNFIKEALISEFDENKEQLNERIILLLFSEGVNFKNELEKILFTNQQLIGSNKIEIDGKSVEPTVANWLKDFIKAGLLDKGMDFDQVQYFNQSKNFQKLNDEEKNLIAKLLDLYWRLKLFPQSFDKLPIEDWYIIPYSGREVMTIKKAWPDEGRPRPDEGRAETKEGLALTKEGIKKEAVVPATDSNQELVKKYYQTLAMLGEVSLIKLNLSQKTNQQTALIIKELITAINSKDLNTTLAALEILAENNQLAVIKKEATLASSFQLEKRLSPAIWQEEFNVNYLSQYLKWLLQEKFKMLENDAAIFGLRLANILRRNGDESFMKIAYGDSREQVFKWALPT